MSTSSSRNSTRPANIQYCLFVARCPLSQLRHLRSPDKPLHGPLGRHTGKASNSSRINSMNSRNQLTVSSRKWFPAQSSPDLPHSPSRCVQQEEAPQSDWRAQTKENSSAGSPPQSPLRRRLSSATTEAVFVSAAGQSARQRAWSSLATSVCIGRACGLDGRRQTGIFLCVAVSAAPISRQRCNR